MLFSDLHRFAIKAKKATYIGNGTHLSPSRLGAHDLGFTDGHWSYLDSYFGGTDFLGQEVIWFHSTPVWAMNYYGRILRPDLIDGDRAAKTLRAALASEQSLGRLIDNLDWLGPHGRYSIRADGDIACFKGRELIVTQDELAYELDYHGGLVRA